MIVKIIKLNQGKEALVDDEDYEILSQWVWTYNPHGGGYASRTDRSGGKQKTILMHRFILDAKEGEQVDHINHNRLDNRRENLRKCTPKQNVYNASKRRDGKIPFKGVYYREDNGYFAASIQHDGSREFLGYYKNELDAAYYYNERAKELFGDFAFLNELPDGYKPVEEFKPKLARGRYSKYRGVTYDKRRGKYVAHIGYGRGKKKYIGYFDTDFEAALAYNEWAIKLHGEKAILNVVNIKEQAK